MTDKQIIKTFSDGYCLVLHENRVSLRENNYTKYQIVVGAKTNELFEFVKELYLDNKAKEQECEELKKELHKNFEEKDTLHLIIDRLLEASGYDTNTASAEDFEDVYEHMRYEQQQLDQLKAELEQEKALKETYLTCYKAKHNDIEGKLFKLKQTLTEIKEIARVNSINTCWTAINLCADCDETEECGLQSPFEKLKAILQKISECEVE